ncbi:alanine racemase [Treponema sp. JC4]|uniref:alanine racemase n=1 Tax=Treponema sp. JC4 TaxID=1124982 RepID=UPI00025B049F|nr:alanine racemase [Treponema sp. JC4]EID85680.1 alanine racemase [Treponema sp. JC4]
MRCTKAVIYSENLKYNLQQIKNHVKPGAEICVAVKADSYGHSAVATARIAHELGGINWFAVATVDEGIELRDSGITENILVLSLCVPEEFPSLFAYKLTPFSFGKEYITALSAAADLYFEDNKKHDVFLAVDTGMGRIGCYPEEAGEQAELISSSKHLALKGMATHFCVSDGISSDAQAFTREQYEKFCTAVENVKARGINPGICSCGNSAAIMNNFDMHFDMVRPGIITYGYYPSEVTKEYLHSVHKDFDIKPVMAVETQVVAIRHFPKGKSVSYGRTYECPEDTDIAILPIGYADGLLRRFSPGMEVTINGRKYPVCGRICMDQCMVNIGKDNPDVKLWDRVVIFGPEESGALTTADDLAKIGNTISYEVLTSISKRVKRIIF